MSTALSPFTAPHAERLMTDGFVIIKNLVPAHLADAAQDAIWNAIPYDRHDPPSWPKGVCQCHEANKLPDVRACFTNEVAAVADAVAGVGHHKLSSKERQFFWPIINFPDDPNKPELPPHVDQQGPIHRTMVCAIFLCLHDIAPDGGGTRLWPGEFKRLEDQALANNTLPVTLLANGFTPIVDPFSATAEKGDAIVWLRNCLHSGAINRSTTPRVGMQTLVHLTAAGEAHCRDGVEPRSLFERNYDRHFEAYREFNYFDCLAENADGNNLYGDDDDGALSQ